MNNNKIVILNKNTSIFTKDKKISKRVYSSSIHREGASFLKLLFSNVNLPKHTRIEFQYGNFIQREFFHNDHEPVIIIPGESVEIRVVLPKDTTADNNMSLELEVVDHDKKSRAIVGEDERKPYMCYEGSEIAEYALSSAAAKIGGYGSCSLIGDENYILTNQHVVVSNPDLTYGDIWFNWFNTSCDPTSPVSEPVRLKPGKLLKMGSGPTGDNDYALFTLDPFDYKNSNVKALFGGLKVSENDQYAGEELYIPQYGNGGIRPMYISDVENGEYTRILDVENNGNKILYNADTKGGSSGSPVISRLNHQLIGLHWGGANVNVGVSAKKLSTDLGEFLEGHNSPVVGLGKVSSYNLELTPISVFDQRIPIDFGKKGGIIPFDTVKIDDFDDHSVVEVEAIDLMTNEIFPLTFKASLVSDDYHTNIHDDNVTGKTHLKLYGFNHKKDSLLKCWVTFKVSDYRKNISNYVIRMVIDSYDPYEVPFEQGSAEVIEFNIKQDVGHSVTHTINGSDGYGYIAIHKDMGPSSLVWAENGYSVVTALLKNTTGDEVLVKFRGTRGTACSTRTMNSSAACGSSNRYSKFVLKYLPEDNEQMVLEKGSYEGIIPLHAQKWNTDETENILIKVNVSI